MGFKNRNVRCKVLGGSVPSHSRREFYHEGVDAGYKFVSDSLQSLCRLCLRSVARSVQSESAVAMEMAAPPSRLGGKLLGLPVNSGRIRKHEKTTTCEFTGGACGKSYRSRPLMRGFVNRSAGMPYPSRERGGPRRRILEGTRTNAQGPDRRGEWFIKPRPLASTLG